MFFLTKTIILILYFISDYEDHEKTFRHQVIHINDEMDILWSFCCRRRSNKDCPNIREVILKQTVKCVFLNKCFIHRLRSFGVKPILDYSVEEDLSQEEAEKRELE